MENGGYQCVGKYKQDIMLALSSCPTCTRFSIVHLIIVYIFLKSKTNMFSCLNVLTEDLLRLIGKKTISI